MDNLLIQIPATRVEELTKLLKCMDYISPSFDHLGLLRDWSKDLDYDVRLELVLSDRYKAMTLKNIYGVNDDDLFVLPDDMTMEDLKESMYSWGLPVMISKAEAKLILIEDYDFFWNTEYKYLVYDNTLILGHYISSLQSAKRYFNHVLKMS